MGAKPLSRRGQVTVGLLVIALGFGVAAIAAIHLIMPPGKAVLDPVVVLIAGFAFAFGGAILVVPERRGRTRASFGALMITSVALLFDWVAFGPGEHHAKGGVAHLREMSRHVLLASGAVLFNLMALWAWFRARRMPRNRSIKSKSVAA